MFLVKVLKTFLLLLILFSLNSCKYFRTDTYIQGDYLYTGGGEIKITEIKYKDSLYLILTKNNQLVGITKK